MYSEQLVTHADIDRIESSPTNLYHLLRHYAELDEAYTDTLIGQPYEFYDYRVGRYVPSIITREVIRDAFAVEGSKFFPNIPGIETPHALMNLIKKTAHELIEEHTLSWVDENAYRKVEYIHLCDQPIGEIGVVEMDDLTAEEQKRITKSIRGEEGGVINVVENVQKPKTNKLAIGCTTDSIRRKFTLLRTQEQLVAQVSLQKNRVTKREKSVKRIGASKCLFKIRLVI